jgi:hypothetical protein
MIIFKNTTHKSFNRIFAFKIIRICIFPYYIARSCLEGESGFFHSRMREYEEFNMCNSNTSEFRYCNKGEYYL